MKTDTMRAIDRYLGGPLCHLTAPLTGLFESSAAGDTVAVCKFFGMGSICLAHPLVAELHAKGHKVVFLTFAANAQAAKMIGADDVLAIDPSSPGRFAGGVLRAIFILRRRRPTAFINLEFFSRFAALMAAACGASLRAGFHMAHLPVGKLYTHRANLNVYRHLSENYLNMGRLVGLIGEARALADYAAVFPGPDGLDDEAKRIVIGTESSETLRDLRSWPASAWIELVHSLRAGFPNHRIELIGKDRSNPDQSVLTAAFSDDPGVIDRVGETTFDELIAALATADLVVTVDSAPLHLAALLGRPTVGLFGPETPALYGHTFANVRNLYKGLMCSPCLAHYDAKTSVLNCRDNQCMKQIGVDEVMAAVRDLAPPSRPAAKAG